MNRLLHNALERASKSINYINTSQSEIFDQSSFISVCERKLYEAYEWFILTPMAKMYLFGPSFLGWGFWAGQDLSQICSQKTNVPSEFWEKNPLQCVQLITKSFYAMVVVIETILYCWFAFIIIKYLSMFLTYPCSKLSKHVTYNDEQNTKLSKKNM